MAESLKRFLYVVDIVIIVFLGGMVLLETFEAPSEFLKYLLFFVIFYMQFCAVVWILSPLMGRIKLSYTPIMLKFFKINLGTIK